MKKGRTHFSVGHKGNSPIQRKNRCLPGYEIKSVGHRFDREAKNRTMARERRFVVAVSTWTRGQEQSNLAREAIGRLSPFFHSPLLQLRGRIKAKLRSRFCKIPTAPTSRENTCGKCVSGRVSAPPRFNYLIESDGDVSPRPFVPTLQPLTYPSPPFRLLRPLGSARNTEKDGQPAPASNVTSDKLLIPHRCLSTIGVAT